MGKPLGTVELPYGTATMWAFTGIVHTVERSKFMRRYRVGSSSGPGGYRTAERLELRHEGTVTQLHVVQLEGSGQDRRVVASAQVSFQTDLRTNVPLEGGNIVTTIEVSGPDFVRHLAVLINYDNKEVWFVGDARQIVTDLGAPTRRPWWATVLYVLAFLVAIAGCIAVAQAFDDRTHLVAGLLSTLRIFLGAGALAGAAFLLPYVRIRRMTREFVDLLTGVGRKMLADAKG